MRRLISEIGAERRKPLVERRMYHTAAHSDATLTMLFYVGGVAMRRIMVPLNNYYQGQSSLCADGGLVIFLILMFNNFYLQVHPSIHFGSDKYPSLTIKGRRWLQYVRANCSE